MSTQVLVFHPHIESSTINSALAQAAEQVENANVRYMYSLYPDLRIDVDEEHRLLEAADTIVLQFPFYWYSVPPLLTTWFDDVLTYGWAYGSTGTQLHGKKLQIAVSTGADRNSYNTAGCGYTVDELLAPLKATSHLIGTQWQNPFITYGALSISAESLQSQQNAYAQMLNSLEQH
ncbi:NAD(P)H-dependent oxidoreductase [Alloscardovia omnicolens]|uniref:NAD(P)H-dependent oxidoreductase n=1 Tax=Alloscardovia omnicolens TaxID=419015 RepID=UPI003A6F4045